MKYRLRCKCGSFNVKLGKVNNCRDCDLKFTKKGVVVK